MSQLLEQAIAEVQKLPDADQNAIATMIFTRLATGGDNGASQVSPRIDERRRIAGTRITVYDVLTYSEGGWSKARIAGILGVSASQVQAALDFIAAHYDSVMENYRAILARIERGNPPEIEAKLKESHARLLAKREELQKKKAENEVARNHGGS